MRALTVLLVTFASLPARADSQPASPATATSFRSIELRGGGIATVRHGSVRRVTVLGENPGRPIRIDGGSLVIDRCSDRCPRGRHRIEVEIVTPELDRVAVTGGGRIALDGAFPRQEAIAASVSSGGLVDIRRLEAARVAAAVDNGGRILAFPGEALAASVSDGGNVIYWGDPAVTSSIRRGGVVEKGHPADLGRPLASLDGALVPPPLPAVVPPTPPRRPGKH